MSTNHQWITYTAKMSTNLKGIASFVRHVEVFACNPATVNIVSEYSMTLTDEHDAGKQIPWTKSKLFLFAKDPISCQSKLPVPSEVWLLDASVDTMQCCPWMLSCRNLTHSVKWPGFPRLPCKRPDGSFAQVSNTEVIFYALNANGFRINFLRTFQSPKLAILQCNIKLIQFFVTQNIIKIRFTFWEANYQYNKRE